MKFTRMVILCVAALTAVPAFAPNKSADTNMQILLDKVKADKKLVVAANMDLTDASMTHTRSSRVFLSFT